MWWGYLRYSQALSKTGLETLPNQRETIGFAVFRIGVLAADDYIAPDPMLEIYEVFRQEF
jgi:hypothetical protein